MRTVLQVLFGMLLCVTTAIALTYSRFPFFWETQYPDGSCPISWRSGLVFLVLLGATQWIAFLLFRLLSRLSSKSAKRSS